MEVVYTQSYIFFQKNESEFTCFKSKSILQDHRSIHHKIVI